MLSCTQPSPGALGLVFHPVLLGEAVAWSMGAIKQSVCVCVDKRP